MQLWERRPRTQVEADLARGIKPRGPVEIDWQHPLAKNLTSHISDVTGMRDIVSGTLASFFGTTAVKGSQYGLVREFDGNAANYVTVGELGRHQEFTVFIDFIWRGVGDNGDHGAFIDNCGAANSKGYKLIVTSTDTLRFRTPELTVANTDLVNHGFVSGQRHSLAISYINGTKRIMVDVDRLFYASYFVSGTITYTDDVAISRDLAFSESTPFDLIGLSIWDVGYSVDDVRNISANPYAFLRPANQSPYLISVAAGGGADYTDSLSISATSAVSVTDTYYTPPAYTDALSASATSAITVTDTPGATHDDSITASAVSSITVTDTPGATHEDSITISATSAITVTDGYAAGTNYADSINVSATSAISATAIYYTPPAYTDTLSASATGSASVTETMGMAYRDDLDIVASGTITVTDLYDANADYVDSISATATAGITVDDYYAGGGSGLTYEQWVTIQEIHAWLAELRQLKGLDAANPVSFSDNGTTTSVTTGEIELHITDTGITRVS